MESPEKTPKKTVESDAENLAEQTPRTVIPMDLSQYHKNLEMQSLLIKKMIRNGHPGLAGLNHTKPYIMIESNYEAEVVPKHLTVVEAREIMKRHMTAYHDAQRLTNPNNDNESKKKAREKVVETVSFADETEEVGVDPALTQTKMPIDPTQENIEKAEAVEQPEVVTVEDLEKRLDESARFADDMNVKLRIIVKGNRKYIGLSG
ncbi:hypothetical protein E4T47_01195 [Aureobasidium subglaciale]|nr:hypothetical protein E4T43_00153 [Aureobasidium subglaciale]KAI5275831.1 hypothetical protein E4T47_01195 [Aureobasidium subglaciale]